MRPIWCRWGPGCCANRHHRIPIKRTRPESALRQALRGAGISGLNPKVFLLFLALLPHFINPGADWPVTLQILTLGLVHVTSCAVVYLAVGTGTRRVLRARPAALTVTRFSGAAMIVIGAVLLFEQLIKMS